MNIDGVRKPKTPLGERKMQQIISKTEQLWTNKNFHQTSIADICTNAGVAIGTFYIYFDDKKALYAYLMYKHKHAIIDTIHQKTSGCITREDKEREGIKAFAEYAYTNPSCYNILWGSLSVDKNLFIDYYTDFANSYTKSLSKDASQLFTMDTRTLAYVLMGISNFVSLRAILEQNMSLADIDNMIDHQLMPMLNNGIFS